tara:strand:+ start:34 stop:339 length:306 start_codon:yes stop_codon:yes gene_type:complete
LINKAEELPTDLSGVVGVTAGASAPDEVVNEVVEALNPVDGVHNVRHTLEDEYFPPPRNIRDLLGAIENFARLGFAAPSESIKFADKDIDASEVLESLNLS